MAFLKIRFVEIRHVIGFKVGDIGEGCARDPAALIRYGTTKRN